MSFVEFLQDDPLKTREEVMAVLIQVADELDMPDKRGACVIAGMTVSQEAGVEDNDPPYERRFWCPANHADEESFNYPHDSISDDGRSVSYFQQQKGPNGELWWGTTASEMDLHSAATQFMTRLKKIGYDASTAQSCNDAAQSVQGSGVPWAYAQWFGDINDLYVKVSGGSTPTQPTEPAPDVNRPDFTETNLIDGWPNFQSRFGDKPRLIVLHTTEGAGGMNLVNYMRNAGVSYHNVIGDDGKVYNLVDTDDASWSVLDANGYTINYVFGPSFASWSRQEWLDNMGNGIKIAAYLAVQDCYKYGIPVQVLVGNNYSKLPTTNGITDHNGITVGLKIGDHTDVGKNFPWDVFLNYLQTFSAGTPLEDDDDMFTDEDRALLNRVHFELTNRWESRSIYREPGEGPVDTLVGFELNEDASEHAAMIERLAVLGDEDALRRVIRTAAGKGAVTDKGNVSRAKKILATVPADVLSAYKAAHDS